MDCKIRTLHLALLKCFLLFFIITSFSGCASIVGSSTHTLSIESDQSGSKTTVLDELGNIIYEGKLPAKVVLEKSDDVIPQKSYRVIINKENFQSIEVPIVSQTSNWFAYGNIPWFYIGYPVDLTNSKRFKFSPQSVSAVLDPKKSKRDETYIVKNVFTDQRLLYKPSSVLQFGLGHNFGNIGINYLYHISDQFDVLLTRGIGGWSAGGQFNFIQYSSDKISPYINIRKGVMLSPRTGCGFFSFGCQDDMESIGLGFKYRMSPRTALIFDVSYVDFFNANIAESDRYQTEPSIGIERRF